MKHFGILFLATAVCIDTHSNILLAGTMDGVYDPKVVTGLFGVAFTFLALITSILYKRKFAVTV
jgi:hypothetical protein